MQAALKVVIVDQSKARSISLQEMMAEVNCEVVAILKPDFELLNQIEHHQPDIIIVDINLPDRDILENLRLIQSNAPKPMIMFSQDDNTAMIRRAVEAGVSAYVVDGIEATRLRPVLDAAIATFDQFQQLKNDLQHTRAELHKRKIVDKAKSLLMQHRNITEAEAYQLLRKTAMDNKQKLLQVAENLIAAAELLGTPG